MRIRELRQEFDMTQEELGKKSGRPNLISLNTKEENYNQVLRH